MASDITCSCWNVFASLTAPSVRISGFGAQSALAPPPFSLRSLNFGIEAFPAAAGQPPRKCDLGQAPSLWIDSGGRTRRWTSGEARGLGPTAVCLEGTASAGTLRPSPACHPSDWESAGAAGSIPRSPRSGEHRPAINAQPSAGAVSVVACV